MNRAVNARRRASPTIQRWVHDVAMRIVGVDDVSGAVVLDRPLGHGEQPDAAAYAAGMLLERPIDAHRAADGELVVRWFAGPVGGQSAPDVPPIGQDAGLDLTGIEPVRRQRVAAYALVRSAGNLLATEFSGRTASPGRWGLPGGGIEQDEDPADAVLRETAEETDQLVVLGRLAAVQSSHWIGRSPRGIVQDFHAVRLVYLAECPAPTSPRVLDVDGTTESARWIAVADWARLPWTSGWRTLLPQLLAGENGSAQDS